MYFRTCLEANFNNFGAGDFPLWVPKMSISRKNPAVILFLNFRISVSLSASGMTWAILNDALVSVLHDRMGGGEGEQSQHTAPHLPGTLPSWQRYPGR